MSDIEIAQANERTEMLPITKVAETIGLTPDDLELYGKAKAKLSYPTLKRLAEKSQGNWSWSHPSTRRLQVKANPRSPSA